MASIQKRGKTWQYTISAKPKPIRKGGFRTKTEAMAAAKIVEADLMKGINPIVKKVSLSDYFEEWVKVYKSHVSKITLISYNATHQQLLNYFKHKALQDINKREYQAFLNEYALTHAKTSAKKLNNHIRACVLEAMDEGIIRTDFTRSAVIDGKVPMKKDSEKFMHYEDSQRWLRFIEARLDKGLEYLMLLLAFVSGMRYAELAALTEDDFNFFNNTISIHRSWRYKEGGGFGPLKNPQSERMIKMDDLTMDIFNQYFKQRPRQIKNVHKLVFYEPNNFIDVVTNDRLNDVLRASLKELNIPSITAHGLRHTHASISILEGISIYYISERLGHGDIETTTKYYAHLLNELREKEVEKTVSAFTKIREWSV